MRPCPGAFALVLLPALALAQDAAPDDRTPPDDQLDPPALTATVRARRDASSVTDSRMNSDLVRAAPRKTATDLLRLVPGLVVSQHGGEGKAHQFLVRGFDAVHGQDVELVVGGLRLNEVSHVHAIGYADANVVVPELVRSMTFRDGASRADQGDFAVAGTLVVELGLDRPGATALLETGNFGWFRSLVAYRPEHGDARDVVAATLTRGDGFGPRRAFARASALAQRGWTSGDFDGRVLAGAYGTSFESAGVLRESDVVSGARGFFDVIDRNQSGRASRAFAVFDGTWSGSSERTSLRASAQHTSFLARQNFTGFLRDPVHGDGIEQAQTTLQLRAELTHARSLDLAGKPLLWKAAIGARADELDQETAPLDATTGDKRPIDERPDGLRNWNVGQLDAFAWTEGTWRAEPLEIRLGARLDTIGVRARTTDSDTPRTITALGPHLGLKAGLAFHASPDWTLSLDYGDAFRSPFAPTLVDGQLTPFTRAHTLDLGARFDGTRETFALSGFAALVDDDLFFDHLAARTTYVGPTARAGTSIRASLQPLDALLVSGHATLAHAVQLRDGFLLPGFAPTTARVDLAWTPVFALTVGTPGSITLPFHAGLGLTAVGPRPLRDGTSGPGYVLADARLAARWTHYVLALDVTNLLDARWFDGTFSFPSHLDRTQPASALAARHFSAGAPRQVFVSISFCPESP